MEHKSQDQETNQVLCLQALMGTKQGNDERVNLYQIRFEVLILFLASSGMIVVHQIPTIGQQFRLFMMTLNI